MNLSKNFINNQNYIVWEKEYKLMFDYVVIHIKELKSSAGIFIIPVMIWVMWFAWFLWDKFQNMSLFFWILFWSIILLIWFYFLYKKWMIKYFRKKYTVYKKYPRRLKSIINKGYELRDTNNFWVQKSFREKYFIIVSKK